MKRVRNGRGSPKGGGCGSPLPREARTLLIAVKNAILRDYEYIIRRTKGGGGGGGGTCPPPPPPPPPLKPPLREQ